MVSLLHKVCLNLCWVEIKKSCGWNCCSGPSIRLVPPMEPHPNSCQCPLINYLVYHQVWPDKQNPKCGNCRNISIWRQLLPLQSCHCQLHSENFNSIAKSIARNQISKTCYWWTQMGRFIKWRWKLIKKSQYQSLSLKPNQNPTHTVILEYFNIKE